MSTPTPKEGDVSATVEARRAFDLILQSQKARREGWEARERAILALDAQGMGQGAISDTLRAQAVEAGLGPAEIDELGISKSNVAHVLRERRRLEEALQRQQEDRS